MRTTMKKLALCISITLLAFAAKAQLKGGIVGGVITGPVKIENVGNRFVDVINGNNINGFEAGVFLKPELGFLYLRPEALYQFRNGTVTYTTTTENGQQTATFSLHKVEVPVLLGINLPGPFYVEAGPTFNYIVGITDRYNSNTVDVNQSAMGYRVGVGAEIGPLLLSANMGGTSAVISGNRATFSEPYKFIFGLGFIFGNTKK